MPVSQRFAHSMHPVSNVLLGYQQCHEQVLPSDGRTFMRPCEPQHGFRIHRHLHRLRQSRPFLLSAEEWLGARSDVDPA